MGLGTRVGVRVKVGVRMRVGVRVRVRVRVGARRILNLGLGLGLINKVLSNECYHSRR